MKKLIVTFALCALPILPAAAGLPWTEQMTAAVTPEELKADRFVAFRKADSGMLELICGDTVLQLNPRSFEITVSGKGASFTFRAPEEALVRLQDGSEKACSCRMRSRSSPFPNSGPGSAASLWHSPASRPTASPWT